MEETQRLLCVCVQLGPTLCNPMDCSLSGSSVHGIVQERILEQVAKTQSNTRNAH